MQNVQTDKVVIECRKIISMTNVSNVDGFTEEYIKFSINDTKGVIIGENLKITSYNIENGNLIAEGKINEIKYSQKKQPLIKRLLK